MTNKQIEAMETMETLIHKAREWYKAHDCYSCHHGGMTAILHHKKRVREDACKAVGIGTANADKIR